MKCEKWIPLYLHRSDPNTCRSGTVIGAGFLSVPEDLQGWVSTDTVFAAYVAVGRAVHLRARKMIHFVKRRGEQQSTECRKPAKVDKVKWTALCNTLARETVPFRRVAAASYSGASRLQWPHLMDRGDRSVKKLHLRLYSCFLSAKTQGGRSSDLSLEVRTVGNLISHTIQVIGIQLLYVKKMYVYNLLQLITFALSVSSIVQTLKTADYLWLRNQTRWAIPLLVTWWGNSSIAAAANMNKKR